MEKMEQIESAKNLQNELAAALKLQRFLEVPDFDPSEMSRRILSWLWEQLKNEISSRLSSVDAIVNCMIIMDEKEELKELFSELNSFSDDLGFLINDFKNFTDDEKGGIEDENA